MKRKGIAVLGVVRAAGDVTPTGAIDNGVLATRADLNVEIFFQATGVSGFNTMGNGGNTGSLVIVI